MNKECQSDKETYNAGVHKCKSCKGVWTGVVTPICEIIDIDKIFKKK